MSEKEAEGTAPSPADPLARSLRTLTEGFGIRSATLHADLGLGLRALFQVPEWDTDPLRTLARVTWQLDRLITTQLVGEDLQRVAKISYNLGVPVVRDMRLGERRVWLHKQLKRLSP